MLAVFLAAALATAPAPPSPDGRGRSIPAVRTMFMDSRVPVTIQDPEAWVTDQRIQLFVGETVTVRLSQSGAPQLVMGELGEGSVEPQAGEVRISMVHQQGRKGSVALRFKNRLSRPVHYKLLAFVMGPPLEMPICSIPANSAQRLVMPPGIFGAELHEMTPVEAERCDDPPEWVQKKKPSLFKRKK